MPSSGYIYITTVLAVFLKFDVKCQEYTMPSVHDKTFVMSDSEYVVISYIASTGEQMSNIDNLEEEW